MIIIIMYLKYQYKVKDGVDDDNNDYVNTAQKDPYGNNIGLDTNPDYENAAAIKMDTSPIYDTAVIRMDTNLAYGTAAIKMNTNPAYGTPASIKIDTNPAYAATTVTYTTK